MLLLGSLIFSRVQASKDNVKMNLRGASAIDDTSVSYNPDEEEYDPEEEKSPRYQYRAPSISSSSERIDPNELSKWEIDTQGEYADVDGIYLQRDEDIYPGIFGNKPGTPYTLWEHDNGHVIECLHLDCGDCVRLYLAVPSSSRYRYEIVWMMLPVAGEPGKWEDINLQKFSIERKWKKEYSCTHMDADRFFAKTRPDTAEDLMHQHDPAEEKCSHGSRESRDTYGCPKPQRDTNQSRPMALGEAETTRQTKHSSLLGRIYLKEEPQGVRNYQIENDYLVVRNPGEYEPTQKFRLKPAKDIFIMSTDDGGKYGNFVLTIDGYDEVSKKNDALYLHWNKRDSREDFHKRLCDATGIQKRHDNLRFIGE